MRKKEEAYSIVIPSGSAANLARCAGALFERHPNLTADRIIVVKDGIMELDSLTARYLEGMRPFILPRNYNIGIRAAGSTGDDVVLLDDDAILWKGNFDLLRETSRRENAIVSPALTGKIRNYRQQHRAGQSAVVFEEILLQFTCIYLPRRIIEAAGMFDERYDGYGSAEVDYSMRVKEAGFKMAIDPRCVVRHEGPSLCEKHPDYRELWEKDKRTLKEKWGERAPTL